MGTKKQIETLAIHVGTNHGSSSRAIAPPLETSTTFEHDVKGYQEGDFSYSRHSNPNRNQLEQLLTILEKGEDCAVFSSGIAAMNAVLMSVEKGGHIIIPQDLYHGSRNLLELYSERWGITYSAVDTTDLEKYASAFTKETRLVILETPSNPLLLVTDLDKAIRIAHNNGAIVCADNTFATPFNTNPIEYGADLVMHSTSKYLGGHSDILGGALVAKKTKGIFQNIRTLQTSQGAVPSPRDCWLLSRSIKSFPVRMKAHNENAQRVAEFLLTQKNIERVNYPGLSSHPNHEIAKAQMRGFSGMISFLYKGGFEETLKVVAASTIIRRATSLGGIESLWEHRRSSESESSTTPENLIRFSVGLEHVEDIISDIEKALNI